MTSRQSRRCENTVNQKAIDAILDDIRMKAESWNTGGWNRGSEQVVGRAVRVDHSDPDWLTNEKK